MALIDRLLHGVISDDQQILIQMIIHEAIVVHVDPVLAVSVAILESGLNPNAIGDHGTSFGLYQLHEGGELGTMTAEDAFKPVINTRTALKYFESATQPNRSPGEIAAKAQRPLSPMIYAYTVNIMYPLVKQLMLKLGVYHA